MKTGKRLFIISLMFILTFSLISVFADSENYVRSEDTYKGICKKISVLGFDDDGNISKSFKFSNGNSKL